METLFNLLGGRKMTIALLGLIVSVILAYTKPGAITTEFVALILGLVTSFNVANAFNTVNGPRNDSNPSPTSTPPSIDLYSEFVTLTEETKVTAMNTQAQIDTANSRIEALADIIQKSLLTKAPQQTNINVQPLAQQYVVEQAQVSNAELNRQAIQQYLTNQQFNKQG